LYSKDNLGLEGHEYENPLPGAAQKEATKIANSSGTGPSPCSMTAAFIVEVETFERTRGLASGS